MLISEQLSEALSEAISEPVKGKPGKYKYQGKVGVWRTHKGGDKVFYPDDKSGPLAVNKAKLAALQGKKGGGGGGSGAGSLKAGAKVTRLKDIKKGQLLIKRSKQFGTTNVVRVTKVKGPPSPGFEGHFVKPDNPSQKRMASDQTFHVWGDDLKNGEFSSVKTGGA